MKMFCAGQKVFLFGRNLKQEEIGVGWGHSSEQGQASGSCRYHFKVCCQECFNAKNVFKRCTIIKTWEIALPYIDNSNCRNNNNIKHKEKDWK